MRPALFAMIALAALVLASVRPAAASVSGASISTTQPSYTGACPITIKFTGTITGTPGTTLTYSFNQFVSGKQKVVNGSTVTLPSGGSVAVNDSIVISSSTSGSTFDQIWVHNISGGQSDLYSNKANFSVTCGTPPTSSPGSLITHAVANGSVIQSIMVPAPTALSITHDTPTCAAHGGFGGGLACTAGLQASMLALIWNCNNCKVDGYHLYRVDGGQHALQPANGAYSNDATITLALLNAPSDGFNGKCYAVTAYKGANESALSNWACAAAGSVAQTATLSPAHVLHWNRYRESRTGVLGFSGTPSDTYDTAMFVGYADYYGENDFGDFYVDKINRLGLQFDVSSLVGHPISKATLSFSALASWHDYDSHDYVKRAVANLTALSPQACVTIIDLATDRWWLNNDLNSTVSYLNTGPYQGPDWSVDVTKAVSNWATTLGASSNFGFVLRGDDENDLWHGNTNHVCLTQLQSVSLVVTYY